MKLRFTQQVATIFAAVIAALVVVIGYWLTERSKIAEENFDRREARYQALILSTYGFHVDKMDVGRRQAFLHELDQCWLYCPDNVITAGYDFVDAVLLGSDSTSAERSETLGEFMVAIRQDLISGGRVTETSLQPSDYRVLRVIDKNDPIRREN